MGGVVAEMLGVVVSFRGVRCRRVPPPLGRGNRRQALRQCQDWRRAPGITIAAIGKVRHLPSYYKMAEPGVSELASTLQFGSIKRHPSPRHDLNPSTAASEKQPVTLDKNADADSDVDEDEIPVSVLNPVPRKQTMPPLPDLRFEQSYLKSIETAESWQGVAWITLRDQVGQTTEQREATC